MNEQIPAELAQQIKDKANLPKTDNVVVTPKKATAWLNITKASGFKNRAINHVLLDKLCADLRAGKWIPNAETIKLDKEGVVIDGQHRLIACVKTGISFIASVAKNVDREAFSTIDCGCARNASQVLRMDNVKYYKHVAATICTIVQIRKKMLMARCNKMTNTEVLEFYRENSELLDQSIAAVLPTATSHKHLTPRIAAAALFVLVTDYGASWDEASDFVLGCLSNETQKNDIVNSFRDTLNKKRDVKMAEGVKFYNLVLIWNAIHTGKRRTPAFRTEFDEYPEFVHA